MKPTSVNLSNQWMPLLLAGLCILLLVTLLWAADKHLYNQELQADKQQLQLQLQEYQRQQQRLVGQVETLRRQKQELLRRLEQRRTPGMTSEGHTAQGLEVLRKADGGVKIVEPDRN